jgi:peptidoglycan/LPS O-acetylase OafA/YrhL
MKEIAQIPKRFYSLDVVRGLAALCVVLWHWQHFFYYGTVSTGFERRLEPFYSIFSIFYQKGYLAVTLFFSLSGFIFFWLYAKKIADRKINGTSFFVLRFSRLYPLHFVTLIMVLIEQVLSKSITGTYMVYACNDLYHFILNVFFVSFWGFQKGFSFNAPIWSVSIEVFLYIIFFGFSFLGGARFLWITWASAVLSLLIFFLPYEMRIGLFSFFMGGAMFLLYTKLIRFRISSFIWIIGSVTVCLWGIALLNLRWGFVAALINTIPNTLFIYKLISLIPNYFVSGILFPVTLLTLALLETYKGRLGSKIRFLGDISYSTYLLHFPLQLLLILLFTVLHIGRNIFYSDIFFIVFFIVLIGLSYLSFHYFEKPVQQWIRSKWLSKKSSA